MFCRHLFKHGANVASNQTAPHLFLPACFFFLFVYFLTVAEFFISSCHISCVHIFSCGSGVALEALCWLLFSVSLFPSCHLPCRFIPSPHSTEHCVSFLNRGEATIQSFSKCPQSCVFGLWDRWHFEISNLIIYTSVVVNEVVACYYIYLS